MERDEGLNSLSKSYSESMLETESDRHNHSTNSLSSYIIPADYISKDSITNNENTLSLEDMGSLTQQSSIGNEESKQEVKFLVGKLNYDSHGTSKSSLNNSKSLEPQGFIYSRSKNMINHCHNNDNRLMVSPSHNQDRYFISYDKLNDQNVIHQLSS